MNKSSIVLKGSLSFINLGELLQILGGNTATGILKLTSLYAVNPGYVYIEEGNPVNAENAELQGQDALNSLFGWMDAQFEFIAEGVSSQKLIKKNRMELILDGLRMVDDGAVEKLGRANVPQQTNLVTGDDAELPVIRGPLIDYIYVVDEEEFANGKEIVIQEKYGNWLWVILKGTVEVIRLMPEGVARIVRLREGAFVGSLESIAERGYMRNATVVAVERVQVGVLDFVRIYREFVNLSEKLKALLLSLDKRFKQVTTNCADALMNHVHEADINGLTPFITDKQNEEKAFQITAGQARIVRREGKQLIDLCQLSSGDMIGNIPFLRISHEPFSAEVYVDDAFEATDIDLAVIKEEYDCLSATLMNMVQHTVTCTSVTTQRMIDIYKKYADD
jgi:CRP-like cAMP-binding protein